MLGQLKQQALFSGRKWLGTNDPFGLILRYGAVAALIALLVSLTLLPLGSSLVEQWSRRDVEMRSALVFNSIQEPLAEMLAKGERERIGKLFDRMAADSRVAAVAFCEGNGPPEIASPDIPATLTCEQIARPEKPNYTTFADAGRNMLVASFPVTGGATSGHLIILHDLTFAERRGVEARNYLSLLLGGIVLVSGALAVALVLFIMRQWLHSFRQAVSSVARNGAPDPTADFGMLDREIRQTLRQLEMGRSIIPAEQTDWNKETIRNIMKSELPGAEVIVVANREPYIHNRGPDGIDLQIPASGLVSALEPVMRACGGTWIAHGSGSADQETVDAYDRIPVPPGAPEYTLRRIWISGSRAGRILLWPCQRGPLAAVPHRLHAADFPRGRLACLSRHQRALCTGRRSGSQDAEPDRSHPGLSLRAAAAHGARALPDATIITFWHIPWPNSETFGIFPWKEDIIHGLLGSTIVGFHTQFHCNNFLETVDRFIESRIDREQESVTLKGHETFVRPYPISIDWPPAALKAQKDIDTAGATSANASASRQTVTSRSASSVSTTRRAYSTASMRSTSYCSHIRNGSDASRSCRPRPLRAASCRRYKALQDEAMRLADEINARYPDASQPPVKLIIRHHEP